MQSDVPLPYGCKTLADIYADMNETHDSSSVAALPAEWAQPVPHSHESKSIFVTAPVIKLPLSVADTRRPHITQSVTTVSAREYDLRRRGRPPSHSFLVQEKASSTSRSSCRSTTSTSRPRVDTLLMVLQTQFPTIDYLRPTCSSTPTQMPFPISRLHNYLQLPRRIVQVPLRSSILVTTGIILSEFCNPCFIISFVLSFARRASFPHGPHPGGLRNSWWTWQNLERTRVGAADCLSRCGDHAWFKKGKKDVSPSKQSS
jgi:hypothetical protein